MVNIFLIRLDLEMAGDGGFGVAASAYVVFLGGVLRRVPKMLELGSVAGGLCCLDIIGRDVGRGGKIDDFDLGVYWKVDNSNGLRLTWCCGWCQGRARGRFIWT